MPDADLSILGRAALTYARRGWRVFPLRPGTKMPLISERMGGKGYWDATTDLEKIERWWRATPNANIGLNLIGSGLVAVDADTYKPECEWAAFSRGLDLPDTLIQRSARGGTHYIFTAPQGADFPGSPCVGVEIKHKGYILLEPSEFEGQEYSFATDDDPVPAPQWLFAPARDDRKPALSAQVSARINVESEALQSYFRSAIDHELQTLRDTRVNRNIQTNTAAFAIGRIVGAGYADEAEMTEELLRAALETGLEEKEIRTAVRSGMTAGKAQPRELPPGYDIPFDKALMEGIASAIWRRFEQVTVEKGAASAKTEIEWFDDVQPVIQSPYIVKGLIDQGAMSVIYGPSNSGKTFFTLDLAFHVAMAAPWRDRRVRGGSVLYLAAEGGNGIANRIAALRETYGICDVPLALRRAGLDLLSPTADTAHVIGLCREVAKREPLALIVIDTLSRAMAGGDENAASDMTAFIKNVDRIRIETGAHILVVHHTGKDVARGARGHSSLRAATDTEIELQLDEFGNRLAKVTKQRDYEGGEEFYFTLRPILLGRDQDGDEVSTCVVETRDNGPAARQGDGMSSEVMKLMLSHISECWIKGDPLSLAPQTKANGRYAPLVLAMKFGQKEGAVKRLVQGWAATNMVSTELRDPHQNLRGLRVNEWPT